MNLDIFNFTHYREYLASKLKEKQIVNPRFSLRAWSRQLDFKNPSTLSMILKGKRKLNANLLAKIKNSLGLNEELGQYFDCLVFYSNAKTPEEKETYANILKLLRPDNKFYTLELDKFKFISDWYHIAILEMVNLKNFKYDPKIISKRLGDEISDVMVLEAIDRLIRLNLLTKTKNGDLKRVIDEKMTMPKDIPNEYIKNFHAQMIKKAISALHEQDVSEREISSNTFNINKEKIAEAKKLIISFRQKLAKLLEAKDGDETYQLNVQFFKLTKGDLL